MKIFASTACVPGNQNYMVAIERYIDANITNIELGSSHKHFAETDPWSIKKFGISCLLHNYFPPSDNDFVLNLASNDPKIVDQSMQLIKNAIALSASLGAPFYSFHAGFVTDPSSLGTTSYLFRDSTPEEAELALSRFILAVEELAVYAQKHKLSLLVENNVCTPELKGKLLLQIPEEFIEFFDRIAADNIGILLDFGHLNVTATTFRFDRIEFIDRLANRIKAFHIHDNNGHFDAHQPIEAGSWVLNTLKNSTLTNRKLVVEAKFPNVTSLKEHIDWLENILDTAVGWLSYLKT